MDLNELVQSGVYIYQERKYELLRARLPVTSQSDCSVYAPIRRKRTILTVAGPAAQIITSVAEVYGVWNLATNYHGAYFLSFLQTSSLLQAPIQAGLAPDCVEETLYFTNIYFL